MRDTIYRDEAIALVNKLVCSTGNSDYDDGRETEREAIKESLIALPSADRPKGEWIDNGWKGDWQFETDGRGNCWHEYKCSECGFHKNGSKSNYCPNCGADMRERKDFQVIVNGNCTKCGKPIEGNSIFLCDECKSLMEGADDYERAVVVLKVAYTIQKQKQSRLGIDG